MAEGKEPAVQSAAAGGAYASRAYKFATRVDYSSMHDFIVSVEGDFGTNEPAQAELTARVVTTKIAQHKARFEPHILAVAKGTTVEWPNNDDIFHNVFSYSDAAQFDLGLYKTPAKSVKFSKSGRVDVFCSIHASMNCIVMVLDNPYFAKTDNEGHYTIPNVPAGNYKLRVWHERLPIQRIDVVVPEKGEVKADVTMGITGLPQL